MPIKEPVYALADEYKQLSLAMDLPETDEGVSPEAARIISAAGRSALLALRGTAGQPAWFARFEMMMEIGFSWRQATYIAWASMPKEGRQPETQEELAKKYLNLSSDRAIATWRKHNPAIKPMIRVMQTAELWEYRADWYQNLIKGMLKAGDDYKFFNHLKLYGEVTGDYVPLSQLAAVLKNKPLGGAQEMDDAALDELEKQADDIPLIEGGA